jgi:hypothetical protein
MQTMNTTTANTTSTALPAPSTRRKRPLARLLANAAALATTSAVGFFISAPGAPAATYIWNGGTGGALWTGANLWQIDGAPATWNSGNQAIFESLPDDTTGNVVLSEGTQTRIVNSADFVAGLDGTPAAYSGTPALYIGKGWTVQGPTGTEQVLRAPSATEKATVVLDGRLELRRGNAVGNGGSELAIIDAMSFIIN